MQTREKIFSLEILCFVTLTSLSSSANVKSIFYFMEKDKKISDLSNLQEIKVRSSTECATKCGRNDDCFLASFNSITKQCYIGTSVCPVLRTIQTTGWNTVHKTDNCFKTCKGPQPPVYNQRFCTGNPNARAYCLADMELVIKNGVYGSLYCFPDGEKLLSLPACGKYVTDILSNLCNGQFDCSVSVGSTTFGTTNCGGGENLYMYYQCEHDQACICSSVCEVSTITKETYIVLLLIWCNTIGTVNVYKY